MPGRHLPARPRHDRVAGRVSPFIELGVGFNPELTARDNVVVNAALLGMPGREALARFPAIIEFAELERFVDLKLKNYSSGMQVRLGFASMIQADADMYLVDEVLAVGDSRFQQKCFDTFRRLKRERRTVVFVTHDLATVERFCDRAVLLERGRGGGRRRPARGDPHLPPARPRAGAGAAAARLTSDALGRRHREGRRRLVRGRGRRTARPCCRRVGGDLPRPRSGSRGRWRARSSA